ncbi:MAG: hypothetical protein QXS85_05390 [Acidilobaceae archaeon]
MQNENEQEPATENRDEQKPTMQNENEQNAYGASAGVYLVFEFYSGPAGVNETPELDRRSDVVTCVSVEIIAPADIVPLGSGCYRGVPAVHIPYSVVKRFVDLRVQLLRERGTPEELIDNTEFGMIVRVLVVNETTREVIRNILDSVPLRIGDFKEPRIVVYNLKNVMGSRYVHVEKHLDSLPSARIVTLGQ